MSRLSAQTDRHTKTHSPPMAHAAVREGYASPSVFRADRRLRHSEAVRQSFLYQDPQCSGALLRRLLPRGGAGGGPCRWLSFWVIFFLAVWCERFTAVTLTRCVRHDCISRARSLAVQ
jgi:hypothetical protein